jgi:hypothetical protein
MLEDRSRSNATAELAMSKKPIAIIGGVDAKRADYDPPLKNASDGPTSGRALGKALAESEHPIVVFSSSKDFLEAYVVEGYVQSGKAKEKSIIMLYPRNKDPKIHGDFAEQSTQPKLFDPRTDVYPRWEASFFQSLPDVEGLVLLGGGHATLVMGLMALANKTPIVSLATFGGSAEEIWAMMTDKLWIETEDRQEMGRGSWSDDRAPGLVASLGRQLARLDELRNEKEGVARKRQQGRNQRSNRAVIYGVIAATLTALGVFGSPVVFGEKVWLVMYAFCFAAIPICGGMAGAMFYTLRRITAHPASIGEAQAHGFWAGLGSAILFFVSQVTSHREITSLHNAVITGVGGLDILLLFSLMIAFVAGLTYEAVFGKWEAVDASRSTLIETGVKTRS